MLRALEPGCLHMIVAPTYPMLRDATFRSFREIGERLGQLVYWHRTEFSVTCKTWKGGTAEVLFRSADDPDRLRGPNLRRVWIDEASLTKRETYEILLGCLRQGGVMGTLTSTFTPKGRSHWSYEVFGSSRPGVELVHGRTADNPFLPDRFYDLLKQEYGGLLALQELEGQFLDVQGSEWPGEYFTPDIWFDDWPRCDIKVLALDPSKGKDSKHGDYSALVLLGRCLETGILYCDGDLARRPTSRIIQEGLELYRRADPMAWAIETNQFQELLADEIARVGQDTGLMPAIVPLVNTVNKQVRIRRIGPYLARHALRFRHGSPGAELLVQQLREFPEGDHDDGPDALEMAIRVMGQLLHGREQDEEAWEGLRV